MESFQENQDNGFGAVPNTTVSWQRQFPSLSSEGAQFHPDQFHPSLTQNLPPYAYLNMPQQSCTRQTPIDTMAPPRRRNGSVDSEMNSEGSPNIPTQGVQSFSGMVSASPSLSPQSDGSNLFASLGLSGSISSAQGPLLSAAFLSAAATKNPDLFRHYYQSLGQAGCQRRQRSEKKPIPDDQKDDKYFERRRRNNGAAKRSRDARKMRETNAAAKLHHLLQAASKLRGVLKHYKAKQQMLRDHLQGNGAIMTEDAHFPAMPGGISNTGEFQGTLHPGMFERVSVRKFQEVPAERPQEAVFGTSVDVQEELDRIESASSAVYFHRDQTTTVQWHRTT